MVGQRISGVTPRIVDIGSMNTFIAFSVARDIDRVASVHDAIDLRSEARQKDFDPRYYKPLRDAILRIERAGWSAEALIEWAQNPLGMRALTPLERARVNSYARCVERYIAWRKAHRLTNVAVARQISHVQDGVKVFVNPELIADIAGETTVIKLHCRAPRSGLPIPRRRDFAPSVRLLDQATMHIRPKGSAVALVDLRSDPKGPRHITSHSQFKSIDITLRDQLRSIRSIWSEIAADPR